MIYFIMMTVSMNFDKWTLLPPELRQNYEAFFKNIFPGSENSAGLSYSQK